MNKSNEEMMFEQWLEEAKEKGYVKSWKRAGTYEIIKGSLFKWKRRMKTKEKSESSFFCHPQTYTPDYEIIFDRSFPEAMFENGSYERKGKFLCTDEGLCLVDVKGTWGGNNSDIRFHLKQAIMASLYGLYVNKIKVGLPKTGPHLFSQTWYPASVHLEYRVGERKGLPKEKGAIRIEQYAERTRTEPLEEDSGRADGVRKGKRNRRAPEKGECEGLPE